MSTGEKYVVLFRNLREREALTDPESYDAAHATARRLEAEGYTVGSVMTEDAARDYMRDRYAPTYRDAEMKPPTMKRELLRAPDVLDGWVENDIGEAKMHRGGDDPLRGPACTDSGCPAGYPHHGPCPGEADR